MKQKLNVAFTNFWPEWKDEDFITPILSKYYDVVQTTRDPDIVFHSIFGDMRETNKYKCKKILFLGENHRAKKFDSDYTISFDPANEKNYRLPLWQAFILKNPDYIDSLIIKPKKHITFDRFCSFVVTNPSNFLRNGMYAELSRYKRVHSYGKYLNNDLSLITGSQGKYWRTVKDKFFAEASHKFALTYENTAYPYYTTEKIMDAFIAGSLPIYWGDPKIKEDFNEAAFLNVTDHGSSIMQKIRSLDMYNTEFEDVYNQPVFTPEQEDKLYNNLNNFETWITSII